MELEASSFFYPRVDTSTKDATFGVGLQGISKRDVQNVLAIIKETFEKAAR